MALQADSREQYKSKQTNKRFREQTIKSSILPFTVSRDKNQETSVRKLDFQSVWYKLIFKFAVMKNCHPRFFNVIELCAILI